jgi:hypothetical protein
MSDAITFKNSVQYCIVPTKFSHTDLEFRY